MGESSGWPSVLDSPRPYQYLAAVAAAGSVGAGAKTLGASQAAVSAGLAKLEEALGLSLFKREGRSGTRLTPEGQEVLNLFERFKGQAQEFDVTARAVRRASKPDTEHGGDRLRMAASTTTSEQLVPRWLRLLELAHPGVHASLHATRSDKVIEAVQKEHADVGFIANARRGQDPAGLGSGVSAEEVGGDEVVLVVSPDHRWARRAEQVITINELLEEPQVARERGSGALEVVEESLREHAPHGQEIAVPFRTNSSVALRQAVVDHIRPAFLSSMAVVDQLASGELIKVRVDDLPALQRGRHAIWKGTKSGMITDLIKIAKQNAAP